MENAPHVYAFLRDIGIFTTKSVWPIKGAREPQLGGTTCEDGVYAAWTQELQSEGFEIGLHNVTYHTSERPDIIRGLERFKALFGQYPRVHANHFGCEDAVYWGRDRMSGMSQVIYRALNGITRKKDYGAGGHVEGSRLFWGDVCKDKIDYVRNFTYGDVNTLKACPYMPYFDAKRPYVNNWFASSEGAYVDSYMNTVSRSNQDRLEDEGGACIMYTHFGFSFYKDGRLDPRFQRLMERLSKKNGWFVPVSQLLDFLRRTNGDHEITNGERTRLERRWLLQKIRTRGTT